MTTRIETLAEKANAYKIGGQHMVTVIIAIERELASILPDPFEFMSGAVKYVSNLKNSNIGPYGSAICYVYGFDESDDMPMPAILRPVAENWNEAGTGSYMHGDFNVWIQNASRFEIKQVAKDLPAFIQTLAAFLDGETGEMEEAVRAIQKMIDAVKEPDACQTITA